VIIADREALSKLSRLGPPMMSENVDVDELAKFGTASIVNWQSTTGTLPTRNYNEGQLETPDPISGQVMADTILKGRDTCYACVVRCKRVVEIDNEEYVVDPIYGGPEYETIATFGSYCGIDDLEAIAKANELCNAYGVDTISCGATIAFAMECFEKRIIGVDQTGGLDLRYGNADAMLGALGQILNNQAPLGTVLSQGSAFAARTWGSEAEDCLITVKGQEAPAHMPQAKKSLALIYAANPFGADHQSSEHDPMYEEDAGELYLSRLAMLDLKDPTPYGDFGPEKVRFAAQTQIFYSILDTLELCQFVWGPAWTLYGPAEMVELVRAVTGWDVRLDELMKAGERRLNLLRVFNAREGFTRKEDVLPKKFFKPLEGSGPTAGVAIDPGEFEAALDLYYDILGWSGDGVPTTARLEALGLAWLIDQLPN
jgi:aldehyde:ferredoxin oxidoreductase